ncbi:MAG: methyltransferase domain-containing protein [Caldilineaceae bacterium]
MLEIRHQAITDGLSTLEAYNQLYTEREILQRDSFYLWLISLLQPQPNHTLLDISCGQGRLVELASQQGLDAIGVDFSLTGLCRGQQTLRNTSWAVSDGEQLPFPDQCVDYVTHIGSLEHYERPSQGVSEIARVLKPSGRACVLLPNAYGLLGNIQHVQRTGEIFDDGQPLQRYATRRTWQALLEAGGLVIEQVFPYGEVDFPRTQADRRWLLQRPHKIARGLLNLLLPKNWANDFAFVCRRRSGTTQPLYYPMLPNL